MKITIYAGQSGREVNVSDDLLTKPDSKPAQDAAEILVMQTFIKAYLAETLRLVAVSHGG
jgi:hypothetical protein